jgi:hypothetical protein
MKKQLIKCDFCGKQIDRDEEGSYYSIHYENTPGWATSSMSMSDFEVSKEMCNKCAKEHKINWKDTPELLAKEDEELTK